MTTVQKLLHSVFPPPRPIRKLKDPHSEDEDHNKNSTETGISSAANPQDEPRGVKEDRCQFTFSDGRQCRNQRASLCVHHSSRKSQDFGAEGAPDAVLEALGLESLCGDLTTATNINRALSQVFLLMAQGRISQKQAVAFGYITQLLLQTVPGIRSEYVSVHGYRDWEAKLKENLTLRPGSSGSAAKVYLQDELSPLKEVSLVPNTDQDPEPSSGGENKQPTTEAADHPTRMVVPSERREGRAASPDYADIFRRSRDMMAGKYDTTPEGRREANSLALEIELLNPAPAKPRKDFFGRTVALVRRLREHQTKKSGAASQPPPVPTPTTAPVPSSAPPPPSVAAFEAAAKAAIPAASASRTPCDAIARENNFVAPACPESRRASRRPPEKVYEHASDQYPKTCPKQEMPVPDTTRFRTGHTTTWYAPPSWSGPRPDPFPSRQEKLRRSLQAMGDRRRQHQMQNRAFWR